MANLVGCKKQISYSNCSECDQGFSKDKETGICKDGPKRLDWNSIDMGSFFDEEDAEKC
jgi:hypothetical protein